MNFDELLVLDGMLSNKLVQQLEKVRIAYILAWILARSGDTLVWLFIIAFLLWQKNTLGWELMWSVIVTGILVSCLKLIFHRKRPKEKWYISSDKYSFPSGHAARAAAIAIVLIFAMPKLGILWCLWAILVSLSRVALSHHYLSDVGGGLIIGLLASLGLLI